MPARTIRAAQYLRVSRDLQRSSLPNQAAEIAAFALVHGYEIVATYEDPGRSGLRLEGRPGLQQLLADVIGGEPGYDAILIQDVSRWGRFQDPDEAAHYEFLCRAAGIEVRYCSESPDDPTSPTQGLYRAMKRVMAADFSRELSVKVRRAHRHWAAAGYKMGGVPGYGLRRRLLGEDGRPKALLGSGEYKLLQGERVVLEPGPPEEVETVRRIYRLFLDDRLGPAAIAARLNADGVPGYDGGPWVDWMVAHILDKEKYAGVQVFGQRPRTLEGVRYRAAPEAVVRRPDAWPAIVSRSDFAAVQRLRRRALPLSERDMLEGARRLLAEHGRLTARLINSAEGLPSQQTYHAHFGPLPRLRARLGFYPPPPQQSPRFLPGQIDAELAESEEDPFLESFDMHAAPATYTAFAGDRQIAAGSLAEIAAAAKAAHDAKTQNLILFADATGHVLDLDYRGDIEDVLSRLPPSPAARAEDAAPAKAGRGRPKLGVAAREVTLLPRHWTWLANQPGGASATLRKLVEQMMRDGADQEKARDAQTATYRVMYALAGHLPRYEEALRALYAPDPAKFASMIEAWPRDIVAYVRRLATSAFADGTV